jgi:hypothetical protein
MSESSLPGDEPEMRPHVVQAILSALAGNDSAKLNDLLRSGVTTGEYVEAMSLYGEGTTSLPGDSTDGAPDYHQREFEAIKVLAGDGQLSGATGWRDLFDGLTPERVSRLRDLYDALPNGARAEFNRRYGPSQDA